MLTVKCCCNFPATQLRNMQHESKELKRFEIGGVIIDALYLFDY